MPFRIEEQDTYSVVKRVIPEGATMCSLCSRLRRGVLYRVAGELGATKIALGHHRDDLIATFFLNLFFGGKLKTMPPKLVSDDGRNVVIRPLAYVRERDLARYASAMRLSDHSRATCAARRSTCSASRSARCCASGSASIPGRIDSIFNALGNVAPSHLMDRKLFDFAAVRAGGVAQDDGDIAFDVDRALEDAIELRCDRRFLRSRSRAADGDACACACARGVCDVAGRCCRARAVGRVCRSSKAARSATRCGAAATSSTSGIRRRTSRRTTRA